MYSQDWDWTALPDSLSQTDPSTPNGSHPTTRPGTSNPGETKKIFQTTVSEVSWWSFLTKKTLYFLEWWANSVLNINKAIYPPWLEAKYFSDLKIGLHLWHVAAGIPRVFRGLAAAWADGLHIFPDVILGSCLRPVGKTEGNSWAAFQHTSDAEGLASCRKFTWLQNCSAPKILYRVFFHKLFSFD